MPTVTLKSILRTSQQRSTCWSFSCLCSSSAERSVRSSTSIRYVNPCSSWRSLGLTLSTDASSQHGHTDTHTQCESMDRQTDVHASTIAKNHIKRLNVHQLLCRYGVCGCKTVIELLRSPRRYLYLECSAAHPQSTPSQPVVCSRLRPTSSGVHSVDCRSACELTLSLLDVFKSITLGYLLNSLFHNPLCRISAKFPNNRWFAETTVTGLPCGENCLILCQFLTKLSRAYLLPITTLVRANMC